MKKLKLESYKDITVKNIDAKLESIKAWMNPEKPYELEGA